jgi:hypothetical protein
MLQKNKSYLIFFYTENREMASHLCRGPELSGTAVDFAGPTRCCIEGRGVRDQNTGLAMNWSCEGGEKQGFGIAGPSIKQGPQGVRRRSRTCTRSGTGLPSTVEGLWLHFAMGPRRLESRVSMGRKYQGEIFPSGKKS